MSLGETFVIVKILKFHSTLETILCNVLFNSNTDTASPKNSASTTNTTTTLTSLQLELQLHQHYILSHILHLKRQLPISFLLKEYC